MNPWDKFLGRRMKSSSQVSLITLLTDACSVWIYLLASVSIVRLAAVAPPRLRASKLLIQQRCHSKYFPNRWSANIIRVYFISINWERCLKHRHLHIVCVLLRKKQILIAIAEAPRSINWPIFALYIKKKWWYVFVACWCFDVLM